MTSHNDKMKITEEERARACKIFASLGGRARAAALSPERRREIAAMGGAAAKPDIEQKRAAGKLGGTAAAASLTSEQRRQRAIRAVQAREAKRCNSKNPPSETNLSLPPCG